MDTAITFLIPLGISGLISYFVTPVVIRLAHKFKLVDDVRTRAHPAHIHHGIIPRAGGVALYIGIFISSLLFIYPNKVLVGVLLGGFLIVVMGLLDDYFDLSAVLRLGMNIIIVALVIMFGLGIPYVTNPLGGVIDLQQIKFSYNFFGQHEFLVLANLFALLWIVAIMNFVSWSSGVDGQLSGFTAISSIILGIVALRFSSHDISTFNVAVLGFVVGGAYLGFLPWHFFPQKIMPGYGGGALSGYMLGVLSILSWGKVGTLALVLAVPLVDALYTLLRRIKNKQSPFKGDAGHFHHRLLEIGWGKRRIALFYWFVSLLFGVAALYFHHIQKMLALGVVTIFLACFIVLTNKLKSQAHLLQKKV